MRIASRLGDVHIGWLDDAPLAHEVSVNIALGVNDDLLAGLELVEVMERAEEAAFEGDVSGKRGVAAEAGLRGVAKPGHFLPQTFDVPGEAVIRDVAHFGLYV